MIRGHEVDSSRFECGNSSWRGRETSRISSGSWDSGIASSKSNIIGASRIFIGGLTEIIEEDHVWEYFNHLCESSGCKGRVMSVEVNGTKGYGFVTFDNVDAVSLILKER